MNFKKGTAFFMSFILLLGTRIYLKKRIVQKDYLKVKIFFIQQPIQ